MKNFYLQRVFAVGLLAVLLSGCSTTQVPATTSASLGLLTIVTQRSATPVSASLIGINLELVDLCTVLRTDAAHQKVYEQFFQNFGSSTLHVGGHSADEGIWVPNAKPACLAHPIVTKTFVQSLFAFARRIHWHVIWGLNFLINDPAMDASEAAYVASVGGSSLLGFSIGNEPELFAKHGERPSGWGYSNYLSEWKADTNAVLTLVPTARFIGPEACCETSWFPSFIHDEGASGNLMAATRHYYYFDGRHAAAANLTAASLLSQKDFQRFTLAARGWVAVAAGQDLPVDISEINSISNGGITGISNTFAATLWTSDILFQSASLGIHQLDFQEVPDASYAFINTQAVPQVLYYGLLFFHLATSQAVILPSVLNTTENISAYVLKGTDGTLRIVVINKEPTHGFAFTVSPGSSYHQVSTIRMQAASLTATTGVTLGNATVAANNSFRLPPLTNQSVTSTQTVLSVPASSAALFTFAV